MKSSYTNLAEILNHEYDAVIDVRSPAEFAEDHIPGAINLPVLSNEERAEVGTLYVQDSPFKARKLGAALVFRNAANHIERHLAHHEGGWKPLVYCWRGGQRSGSFAWMLQQIGWPADVVQGGYRTYRRLVSSYLYDSPLPYRLLALDGLTGTAKTAILQIVREKGGQVLDLEALAGHRGSLLGEQPGGQPSQKGFESAIAGVLAEFDSTRPVLVEAEAGKIGSLLLPPMLWQPLRQAPRIDVQVPFAARCGYLLAAYDDILSDGDRLRAKLENLRAHRSHAVVDHWLALIAAGDKPALTEALMRDHYDPAYQKARQVYAPPVKAELTLPGLQPQDLEAAAEQIMDLLVRPAE